MKKMSVLLVVMTVLCFLGGNAWAMLVNTQFNSTGTYSGAAIIGTAGDSWNHVGYSGTAVPLLDSAGVSSGISLTWSSDTYIAGTGTAFSATVYANLMGTYIFNSTSATITYSGLTPNGVYELYLYSQGDSACTGRRLTVSVNGGAPVSTTAAVATASTFIQGQNYLHLSGTANSSGQVVITYFNGAGEANINGLQLVAAPQGNIATTTTVASTKNPALNTDSITFSATVTPNGLTGGTVTFYDNLTIIDTRALVGGTATCPAGSLSVGSHSITATYTPANSSYNSSSTLSTLTQVVNVAPVVNSQAATSITSNTAMLNSNINPNNNTVDLLYYYGTQSSFEFGVSTLAGSTSGFADGTGTAAQFSSPAGVAVDSSGTVYVADTNNHRIRKITSDGVVSTLAGSTSGFADDTGTAARFRSPAGVAVDSSGTVYVADTLNNRIRKITPAGVVSTLAGLGIGFADGTGTAARFNNPAGVAVDSTGTVYVADTRNNCIRKITSAGVVSTLAGFGSEFDMGFADGTGTAALFANPAGVAVDSTGTLYVADTRNNSIRKITSGGVVSTLAGSLSSGSADGTGTAAQFMSPKGVAVDSSGTVYVADSSNNRIRKITPAGVVSTITGSTVGFVDGTLAVAQFSTSKGVTVDSAGTVYVADTGNNRIRKIIPVPSYQSILAQSGLTGSTVVNNSQSLAGLLPETTYYYRAVADYGTGIVYGDILNFTTTAVPTVPTATTNAASSITTTTATLNSTVSANGAATTVTFNYGTTTGYGSSTTAAQNPLALDASSTAVTAALTGLTCNTLYHYRVSGTNSAGTTNGSDATFTTSACPAAPSGGTVLEYPTKPGDSFTVRRLDPKGALTVIYSGTDRTCTDTQPRHSNTIYSYYVTSNTDTAMTELVTIRTPLYPGWNLIGVPYAAGGVAAATLFSSPVSAVYEWLPTGSSDPDNNGYYTTVTTLTPGKGYFVRANNSSTMLTYNGTDNPANITVTLKPGYTVIANPRAINGSSIHSSWIIDKGQTGEKTLEAAIEAETIGGGVDYWNGSGYDVPVNIIGPYTYPIIEPWKAYWLLNKDAVDHTVTIP